MDGVDVEQITSQNSMEQTCKATIQQGASKGTRCWRPSTENGYCGKHQTQHKLESGEKDGLHKCGTHRCVEMISLDRKYCDACIVSKETIENRCKSTVSQGINRGNQCPNSASTPEGYCGKHAIQILVDKATSEGRRICDDAKRKCRNYTLDGKVKCEECLDKIRESERQEHVEKRENGLCLGCGCELETVLEGMRTTIQRCKSCYQKLKEFESKRARERNYAAERKENIQSHYAAYRRGATLRNLVFDITIETFERIVNSPCRYCGYYNECEVIGIDRLDSLYGYTHGNIVPCCEVCNRMKQELSVEKFTEHAKAIVAHCEKQTPPQCEFTHLKKSYVRPKKIAEYYRKGKISEYIQLCVEDERNSLYVEKLRELETMDCITDITLRNIIKYALRVDSLSSQDKTRINPNELFAYLKVGQITKCVEAYVAVHGTTSGFREDIELLVADWVADEEANRTAFNKVLLKYRNKRNR